MSMLNTLTTGPLFGVVLTLGLYSLATILYTRKRTQLFNPLVITAVAIMVILSVAKIPVERYRLGADMITFWLGPATVALAVPLHRQAKAWRRYLPALVIGTLVGSIAGLCVAPLLALALGAGGELAKALIPRSVTTAIAVELARTLGAIPELTAGFVIVTGVLGNVFGPRLLKLTGIHDPVAGGLSIGVASHGIGTARMLAESEQAGAASGMGMSLAGLLTAAIVGIYTTLYLSS